MLSKEEALAVQKEEDQKYGLGGSIHKILGPIPPTNPSLADLIERAMPRSGKANMAGNVQVRGFFAVDQDDWARINQIMKLQDEYISLLSPEERKAKRLQELEQEIARMRQSLGSKENV